MRISARSRRSPSVGIGGRGILVEVRTRPGVLPVMVHSKVRTNVATASASAEAVMPSSLSEG